MKLKLLDKIKFMSKICFYGIVLQLFMMSMLLASNGEAQKYRKVSEIYLDVGFKKSSLLSVFEKIEKHSEFKFFYYDDLPGTRITLDRKKRSLEETLHFVGKKAKLSFKRVNNNISVSNWSRSDNERHLPQKKIIVQELTVSGKVTDENGINLPGVNVLVKNSTNGTVTDRDGFYQINVEGDNATLIFSFIGYISQEVPVNGRSTVDLALTPDLQQLQEIVVIGYDVVKKSDLTGSVASVSSNELTAYPAISAVAALQGRASGVQVQSNNGEPGASFKVRIRGGTSINASSDPLFVVDGFIGGILPSPEDIASIEVLKDASATAIYGSRGANGVVMITTKRGADGPTRISFNASYSSQEEIGRLDLLNRDQFIDLMADSFADPGNPNPGVYPAGNADTDWQEEIFRTGGTQNYQLSFSGGNKKVNYYLSGTYYDQKGVIHESSFDRFAVASNISLNATEKLKFGLNIITRRSNQEGTRSQLGSGGGGNLGVITGAYYLTPDVPVFNSDGSFGQAIIPTPSDNPFATATQYVNESVRTELQGNVFAEYTILDGLTFKSTFGSQSNNSRVGTYFPRTLITGQQRSGSAQVRTDRLLVLQNEDYFTYKKSFGEHSTSLTAGYSYQSTRIERLEAGAEGFVDDLFTYNNLSAGTVQLIPKSELTESNIVSFFGRLNYALSNRFLVTFTGRYDGGSVFSEGKKWAFFPSGAIAWNIGNESFLSDNSTINDLKLRVSYGQTGNQAVNPYQTFASIIPVFFGLRGAQANALKPASIANPNLTWETTTQFDIGVDIGLLDDRVNVIFDYYTMETNDLLFEVPLPSYSGFASQIQNVGSVENKGWELSISSDVLTGDLDWNTTFNISANRNKITELPDGGADILYGFGPGQLELRDPNVLRVGSPVGSFYGYEFDGVYQSGDQFLDGGDQHLGGAKYRDLDDNGTFDPNDRTIIGNPNPNFIWGWSNDFTYKGFDLNIFISASQGNDVFSYSLLELNSLTGQSQATTEALNRWTPSNTNTNIPAARNGGNRFVSSRFVYDGSFIRFKNIALGYNFPASVLDQLHLNKLRFYISAQNLFTITDYPGVDPEVNYSQNGQGAASANRNLGFDYGTYPQTKSFTIGLNVGF